MSLNRRRRRARMASWNCERKLVGHAEQVAAPCLLQGVGDCAPLPALSRLPVIVGCRIGGGGKKKHLMVSIRLHPAMPKEDDPLCSRSSAIRCVTNRVV